MQIDYSKLINRFIFSEKIRDWTSLGLLIIFLILPFKTWAQGSWEWAIGYPQTRNLSGSVIQYDNRGNIITGGQYISGEANSSGVGTVNFPANNGPQWWIAKYDTTGNFLWAKYSSSNYAPANLSSIVCDTLGNIYVSGIYQHAIWIDSIFLFQNDASNIEMFIVKYSPQGKLLWAYSTSGNVSYGFNNIRLAYHPQHGLFASGQYTHSIHYRGLELQSASPRNMFLLNIDLMGNGKWIKGDDHSSNPYVYLDPQEMVVSESGKIHVAGRIMWTTASSVNGANISYQGSIVSAAPRDQQIFLLKTNHQGIPEFIKSFGGPFYESTQALCLDYQDNIILSGEYSSQELKIDSVILINAEPNNTQGSENKNVNGFIIKLDQGGRGLSGVQIVSTSADRVIRITGAVADKEGNIIITSTAPQEVSVNGKIITGNSPYPGSLIMKLDSCLDVRKGTIFSSYSNYSSRNISINSKLSNAEVVWVLGDLISSPFIAGNSTITLPPMSQGHQMFWAKWNCQESGDCVSRENAPFVSDTVSFLIWPNPSSKQLFIKHPFEMKLDKVTITDMRGRSIASFNLTPGEQYHELSLEGFASGIYYLQLYTDDKIIWSDKFQLRE